mmetsp:Transcript_1959/g.8659  ORF Transcript_1959/g.8659 Transcript_1959/m.8659 type:complete len:428 (+) Transcript_1959:249-1532(+)
MHEVMLQPCYGDLQRRILPQLRDRRVQLRGGVAIVFRLDVGLVENHLLGQCAHLIVLRPELQLLADLRGREAQSGRAKQRLGEEGAQVIREPGVLISRTQPLAEDDVGRLDVSHHDDRKLAVEMIHFRDVLRAEAAFLSQRLRLKGRTVKAQRPRFADAANVRKRLLEHHRAIRPVHDEDQVEVSVANFLSSKVRWVRASEDVGRPLQICQVRANADLVQPPILEEALVPGLLQNRAARAARDTILAYACGRDEALQIELSSAGVRSRHALLGGDGGDEPIRRDVEGWIPRVDCFRRNGNPFRSLFGDAGRALDAAELVGGTELDGDAITALHRQVQGCRRSCHDQGNAEVGGRDGKLQRANLVGGVTIVRHTICATHTRVYTFPRYEEGRGGVGNQRAVQLILQRFVGGKPGSLQVGSRLHDVHLL